MKSIAAFSALFGLFLALLVSPLHAQDETDDLYINSKDITKRREKAKEQVSVEKNYYTYPQPGSSNDQSNSSTVNSQDNRFNSQGYTNKYIEAEKNEPISSSSSNTVTNSNNQTYNSTDNQTEDIRWYKHNKRNLRRKAYGSQYSIAPVIGYNNFGGWNTGIGFSFNSGWNNWNNWYGWNSPYYNGWNNFGYDGFGGGGFGFNN